ncbi:regulatory protein RecX [Celerinatantimonas yamalensis]|uniref:Regulatory protein RecX n=1 Tax=Celerinatantimonas yamalensis TaxID=559956 RepID=A0ABW9G7W3_9GAMM
MRYKQKLSAKGAVVELLSRRGYSRAQLVKKLKEKEYSTDEIEQALDYAQQQGWINDFEFAMGLTRSRLQSGYGGAYIRQYLTSKGVSSEIAAQVIADEQWDWWQALERAFSKKYRQLPQTWPERRKCQAYLYRRGFDSDLIRQFFEIQSQSQ